MSASALPRIAIPVLLGALLAVCLYPVWGLEGRWFVVTIVGVALASVSMVFAGRLSDFLLAVLIFSVPLAGFAKWSFLDENFYPDEVITASLYSGTLGVGFVDIVIAGLYASWALRIFVMRDQPLPTPRKTDIWVALVLLSYALSLWGTDFLQLGLYSFEHILKHVLVYFYVSRHFRRSHLPWYVASLAVAILAESAIGLLQYQGILPPGLILDKGAGSDRLETQYSVLGIEDVNRATGLSYDSHALGIYLAMLLPTALAFLFWEGIRPRLRMAAGVLLALGLAALVVTYARSAWLGGAISLGTMMLALLAWRERHVFPAMIAAAIAGIIAAPWLFRTYLSRLIDAPPELLYVRFEQFPVAWNIWRENFLFGAGAGTYTERLSQLNLDWSIPQLVHFVPLFVGAELGLFGVVAYYGLMLATMKRLWTLASGPDALARRVAFASLAGLLAYAFDGMSSPLFREPTTYLYFWIIAGLSAALLREAATAPR